MTAHHTEDDTEGDMETMGRIFTGILALAALGAAVVTVLSAEDIKRYLEIKQM